MSLFVDRSRASRGDTIVEVLIAITVASLVLAGAYVTAHHSTLANESTQEHSQALQLAKAQVEHLRSATSIEDNSCFDENGDPQPNDTSQGPTVNPCIVMANGKLPSDTGFNPVYSINITTTDGGQTFRVVITWDSLLTGNGQDRVSLYYRPEQG